MSAQILGYNASNALATDLNSLNGLKNEANNKSPQAVREAAKQLESLFMREMIKSMREATMKSGLMDEEGGGDLARDMYDQQLSVTMAGLPGGLTASITAQIARSMGIDEKEALAGLQQPVGGVEGGRFSMPSTVSLAGKSGRFEQWAGKSGLLGTAANAQVLDSYGAAPKGRDNFVLAHSAAAQRVAQESGIPAHYMLGQAGHETGWGKSEIRGAGGANSFNLFGIKAGPGWKGKVAEITTTEYINGQAQKVKAKFRAYDSYEESFRDYARLISQNPRYAQAMQSTASAHDYARALQKAGYATDPQYANKLSRAIESARAVQRADQA
jgi:peptidoglycan hydrolase FlgJ